MNAWSAPVDSGRMGLCGQVTIFLRLCTNKKNPCEDAAGLFGYNECTNISPISLN